MWAGKRLNEKLVEALPVAVYTTDAAGRLTLYNGAAAALWGRRPVLGNDLWCGSWRLFWPDGAPMRHDECPMAVALRENRPVRDREAVAERPDGTRVFFAAYPTPLHDDHGTLVGAINVLVDITGRKVAESLLQMAKDEAEAATRAKAAFLAAASHDLRQPLNAMSLLLGSLRRRLGEDKGEGRIQELLDRLDQSQNLMIGLFNALLDLSKLDAGAVAVHPGCVPVTALFAHLRADYAEAARARGLGFRLVPCHGMVWSDAALLERILRNLVSNAIQHTRSGRVLIGCRHRGRGLRIDVLDTGPGIPPEQIEAIFQEFVQIDNAARSRDKGYGLGLAIVRRAAQLLNLRVEVASVPGRGSRFSIEVPLTAETPVSPASIPGRSALPADKSCSVLLIEDDPLVGEAMQWALSDLGCTVRRALSFEEALSVIRIAPPQAVITDFRLPGPRDGLDIVAALRTQSGRDIPAWIITGDLSPDLKERAERLRVHYQPKPVSAEALEGIVREIMRG